MTYAEEEKRKDNKKMRQNLHHFAKGLGLELIVGMLLSCLADPKTSLFQWCVHRKGRQSGGDCATQPSRNSGPVANAHVKKALKESGRKRVYCIMVSRTALNDSRMRRHLEEAPGKLDEEVHERAKFLVFGICEVRYIGYRLHKFYCQRGPTNVRPVTGDVLSALLDSLLAHNHVEDYRKQAVHARLHWADFREITQGIHQGQADRETYPGYKAEDGQATGSAETTPDTTGTNLCRFLDYRVTSTIKDGVELFFTFNYIRTVLVNVCHRDNHSLPCTFVFYHNNFSKYIVLE